MIQIDSKVCKHCQKPWVGVEDFCCEGCAGAYVLIHAAGMDQFYEHVNRRPLPTPKIDDDVLGNEWSSIKQNNLYHQLPNGLVQLDLGIEGITCGACAWLIERIPLFMTDVRRAVVDMGREQLTLVMDQTTDVPTVVRFFAKLGFHLSPLGTIDERERDRAIVRSWYLRVAVACASFLGSMHVSLTLYAGFLTSMSASLVTSIGWIAFVVALPALVYAAQPFYRQAWAALQLRRLNVDVLVTLSILLGTGMSVVNVVAGNKEIYFDAVTMLVAALLVGRMLVFFSERHISRSRLFFQWQRRQGFISVKVQDSVQVRSGEVFPCDGVVESGVSDVDDSWITGEALPRRVQQGDVVWAGAINCSGALLIRAENTGEQTRAARLIRTFHSLHRGRMVVFSERLEAFFVSAILILVFGDAISGWHTGAWSFARTVALLMVTCPCALGLAVPAVVSTALSQAARTGILLRGGDVLERLLSIQTIIFDKTGTLTSHIFQVARAEWFDHNLKTVGEKRDHAEHLLATMAQASRHVLLVPLQKQYAKTGGSAHVGRGGMDSMTLREVPGVGVECDVAGHRYTLGRSVGAMQTAGWADTDVGGSDKAVLMSMPMVIFARDQVELARFWLHAPLRPGLKEVIQILQQYYDLAIISGDRESSVRATANQLAISEVWADHTPEMKLDRLEHSVTNKNTMVVGDGINDILAFKKSLVSVAVCSQAGLSIEQADIALLRPRFELLLQLFDAAKRVRKAMIFNFCWVFIYNSVGIALVYQGRLGPLVCAVLMPLSSLSVIVLASCRRYFPVQSGG